MSTPSPDLPDSPVAPLGAPLGTPLAPVLAPRSSPPLSSLPLSSPPRAQGSGAFAEAPPVPIDPDEMRAGLPVDEVRRRLARASRHEETGGRLLAFYLAEMDARRIYQLTGHGSTAHYAEVYFAHDRRRVAELIRAGNKLVELREVDRAVCEGRLNWAKALILARMATPEHEAAWLERALALDVRALARLAARSKPGGAPRAAGDEKGLPEIRFPVAASLSPLVHAKLEQAQRRLGDELGRPVDVAGLLDVLLDQYHSTEADGSVPGRRPVDASIYHVQLYESGKRGDPLLVETEDGPMPVDGGGAGPEGAISEAIRCDAGVRNHYVAGAHGHDHGHDHRARDVKTPSRMREHVLRRDGRRCRSCRSRDSLMVHHIEFRSHGGRTLPCNLISVCLRCHGLVHAALLRIEGASVNAARFVDASGWPVNSPAQISGLEIAQLTPPAPVEGASVTAGVNPNAAPIAAPGATACHTEGFVTLASIPAEVDATWWRRHARLVRDRGERGNLSFTAGTPEEVPPPDVPALAPATEAFAGLVGQEERILRLRGTAEGVRGQGRRFPHTLLTGPAGTGKSTLARGIAVAAGQPLAEVSAPLLSDRATFLRFLAGVAEGSVVFLDEVHALPRPLLDALLEGMAEGRMSLVLSDGVRARHVTLRLPRFTLVAATTDEGAIPPALRSRFGLREILVHYSDGELADLVRKAAPKVGAEATEEGALRLAQASRGTPREALRLLDRVMDTAPTTGTLRLDEACVERTLARLGYDEDGLDLLEQRYLEALRESPTPVPLSRLARVLGTTPQTLIEHVEPWLFRCGLVRMTPGGRTAATRARLVTTPRGAPNVRHGAPRARRTS